MVNKGMPWAEILSKHNLESPGYVEAVEATRRYQEEKKAKAELERQMKEKKSLSKPRKRKYLKK